MSEVMLTLIDTRRSVHGELHGSIADRAIAALSAEPETIEELQAALLRFGRGDGHVLNTLRPGVGEEPWDAGLVIIDLAARIVAVESSYSSPQREGTVLYHDGTKADSDVRIFYRIPDDWLFTDFLQWKATREKRRAQRAANEPLDARRILYGDAMTRFIVSECLSARNAGFKNPIAEIHARWLMTPREELRGQIPRDILLAKRQFIDLDLQWRSNQWSMTGSAPPELSTDTTAYRFAGFGVHENVLYYDLMRFLISECWNRVASGRAGSLKTEVDLLNESKTEWLFRSRDDSDIDMSPADIIEHERRRLPVVMPTGTVLSDDCEICRMMAEGDFGPMFWHLDGSNIDDDFPFSFYLTREEWEEEQRRYEEFSKQFNEDWSKKAGLDRMDLDDDVIN